MFSLTDFVNGAFKVNHTDTLADVITTALIGILSSLSLPQPIIGAVPGTGKRAKAKCDVFNTISKLTKRTHAKKEKPLLHHFVSIVRLDKKSSVEQQNLTEIGNFMQVHQLVSG